jgi:hypothetical protein
MKLNQLNFLIVAVCIIGCNENNVDSQSGLPSGRSTISTKIINFRVIGFSFAKGDTVVISNASSIKSDIMPLVHISSEGGIIGVYMASNILRPTFRLMYESASPDSAKTFFHSLKEFTDSAYSDLAAPVKANQVWIVKTHDDKYAKMMIVNTLAYSDSSSGSVPTPYGEVTFEWVYQPNGERKFQ